MSTPGTVSFMSAASRFGMTSRAANEEPETIEAANQRQQSKGRRINQGDKWLTDHLSNSCSRGAGRRVGRACPLLRFINTTTFVASIFGSGQARRGSIPRSGAVTEEPRWQNRKAAQPFGRRFFLAQTSLLTPYRPLKGMRVARASSGPKIPRRKRGRIYEMEY